MHLRDEPVMRSWLNATPPRVKCSPAPGSCRTANQWAPTVDTMVSVQSAAVNWIVSGIPIELIMHTFAFGRQVEWEALGRAQAQPASLVVLYGPPQVGKTSLLSQWANHLQSRQTAHIAFWTATTQSGAYQLADFSRIVRCVETPQSENVAGDVPFLNWEAAFRALAERADALPDDQILVVILDQLTDLIRSDRRMLSALSSAWSERLARCEQLRLILCASSGSDIGRQLLDTCQALDGAVTILRVRAHTFPVLRNWLPTWTVEDRLAAYGVGAGLPAVARFLGRESSFEQGLFEYALTPSAPLIDHVRMVLRNTPGVTPLCESVLAVLARHDQDLESLAAAVYGRPSDVARCLNTLEAVEWVESCKPGLPARQTASTVFALRVPTLRLFYRWIMPERTAIQRGLAGVTTRAILHSIRQFTQTTVFEEVSREWLQTTYATTTIGETPDRPLSFWSARDPKETRRPMTAVDDVERRILVADTCWTRLPVGWSAVSGLVARARALTDDWSDYRLDTVLFSRAGFAESARIMARESQTKLVSLSDLETGALSSAGALAMSHATNPEPAWGRKTLD